MLRHVIVVVLFAGTFLSADAIRVIDIAGPRDLVFVHVPYNFGHTVESVSFRSPWLRRLDHMFVDPFSRLMSLQVFQAAQKYSNFAVNKAMHPTWMMVNMAKRRGGEIWGRVHPDLQDVSNVTGCPFYFTPQKYWPKELAERYFGKKQIFGILRDPYERLVAEFRGNGVLYGGEDPENFKSCDVSSAIKKTMKDYLAGDKYARQCNLLPQAEYFDEPYGITVPIDNRYFPESMNQAFEEHGYANMHIKTADIYHVYGCENSWAGDLDEEAKSLVKQVYARDFELLCKHFSYCVEGENTCLTQVPGMCPAKLFEWDSKESRYHPRKK